MFVLPDPELGETVMFDGHAEVLQAIFAPAVNESPTVCGLVTMTPLIPKFKVVWLSDIVGTKVAAKLVVWLAASPLNVVLGGMNVYPDLDGVRV